MKKIFLALLMLVGIHAMAQSDYDVLKDKKSKATIYKGECTFDDLQKNSSFSWLQRGASEYNPDTAAVKYLKQYLPNYQVVVFMGTWCDDTYTVLPKLYKILQVTGYPMKNYTMYGVDKAKEAKYVESKLYKIENVPTIIVMRNMSEIGRIVEVPRRRVEVEIASLIQDDLQKQEMRDAQKQQ
ncbi:MAG: hypothetical protein ACTHJ0_15010 [Flavipsychrobacter sp.]